MSDFEWGFLVGLCAAFIPSLLTFAFFLFCSCDLREETETPRALDELDRIVDRVGVEMRRRT